MPRFQIEDILAQDHHGVVFSALDQETGRQVALRRFFPFGADGGGLQAEEHAAYDIAVKRLSEVVNPCLRAVVSGGCDPIDGMPFLATEWVEGSTLGKLLQHSKLSHKSVILLMNQALEVSELLSQVLADDEVWVETSPNAIVIGEGSSERGVTFWISPFRWLGTQDSRPGLAPLVELLENAMGWTGKKVSAKSGGGLGEWHGWLKQNIQTGSLAQARATLASATSVSKRTAKVPSAKAIATKRLFMVKAKPKTSWLGPVTILLLVLTAISLGTLVYFKKLSLNFTEQLAAIKNAIPMLGNSPKSATDSPESAESEDEPQPIELITTEKPALTAEEAATQDLQLKEMLAKNGVFEPKDLNLVALNLGKSVKIEGLLVAIGESKSKKTGYLRFTTDLDPNFVEGKFAKQSASLGMTDEELQALVGKRIRLSGIVEKSQLHKVVRVQISIPNRTAIEILP
jgi:hypothetical protein